MFPPFMGIGLVELPIAWGFWFTCISWPIYYLPRYLLWLLGGIVVIVLDTYDNDGYFLLMGLSLAYASSTIGLCYLEPTCRHLYIVDLRDADIGNQLRSNYSWVESSFDSPWDGGLLYFS